MESPSLKISKEKWLRQHGAALVEFAIVLPLLLLLVGGIIEFGLLFYNKQVITNASREGARAGIVYPFDGKDSVEIDIDAIVQNYCEDRLITFGDSNPPTTTAPDPTTLQNTFYPSDLNVTVTFTHSFLFSSFLNFFGANFGPTIDLSSTTVMRME